MFLCVVCERARVFLYLWRGLRVFACGMSVCVVLTIRLLPSLATQMSMCRFVCPALPDLYWGVVRGTGVPLSSARMVK